MKRIILYISCLLFPLLGMAQQVISEIGKPIVEDFNKLPEKNGEYTLRPFKTALPNWDYYGYWQNPNPDVEFVANDGSKGTGAITSFGVNGDKDRALGSIAGGQFGELYLAYRLINKTKKPITSFKISFDFQQWRTGSSTSPQGFKLAYFKGNKKKVLNPKERLTWRYLPSQFTPTAPLNTGVLKAVVGNNPNNMVKVTGEFELNLLPGEFINLVWVDENSDGYDHGIAIDNLELTPMSNPEKKVLVDAVSLDFGTNVVENAMWEDLNIVRRIGEGEVQLKTSKSFKLRKRLTDEWVQELSLQANEDALYIAYVPESEGEHTGTLSLSFEGSSREIPLKGVAQKKLNPGDIAIVNLNCTGTKNLQFITLEAIAAGTRIYITDKSWKGIDQGFSEEEHIISYTFPSDTPAGTIISFKGEKGFVAEKFDLNYSAYYETILFFQGNQRCPHFFLGVGIGEQVNYLFQDRYVDGYVTTVTPANLNKKNRGIILFGKEDIWEYDAEKYPLKDTKEERLKQLYDLKLWKKSN